MADTKKNPDALGPWEDRDGSWARYGTAAGGRDLRVATYPLQKLYSVWGVGPGSPRERDSGDRRAADLAFLRLFPGATLEGGVFGGDPAPAPPPSPSDHAVRDAVRFALDHGASTAVLASLLARDAVGLAKYGVSLTTATPIDARAYAEEEAADLVVYATLGVARGEPWAEETRRVALQLLDALVAAKGAA